MNMKMSILLAAGLILTACNQGKVIIDPIEAFPAYDATGNWGIKLIASQPNKSETVIDFLDNSLGIPLPTAVTMLDKTAGDFIGTVTYQGQNHQTITGNTRTGAVHVNSFLASPDNVNLWFNCSGQFNAAQHTYTGLCDVDPATATQEEVEKWKAEQAKGAKITLQLTRL